MEAARLEPTLHDKVRFVAQLPQRKRRKFGIREEPTQADRAAICFDPRPHPLERPDYERLIRETDIGLFLHDNRKYAAQCSGVLHEVLAAGKPVIVPGGSWLASQIAEPIFSHIEGLCEDHTTVGQLTTADLQWQSAGKVTATEYGNGIIVGPNETVEARIAIPAQSSEIVVGFRWSPQSAQDQHLQLQLRPMETTQTHGVSHEQIVGHRRDGRCALSMFRCEGLSENAVFQLGNDQDDRPVSIQDIQVRFLRSDSPHGVPAGSVGLIAATSAQIPDLLRDMTTHFEHYRVSAVAFSHIWRQAHHPSQTLATLTGREAPVFEAA